MNTVLGMRHLGSRKTKILMLSSETYIFGGKCANSINEENVLAHKGSEESEAEEGERNVESQQWTKGYRFKRVAKKASWTFKNLVLIEG